MPFSFSFYPDYQFFIVLIFVFDAFASLTFSWTFFHHLPANSAVFEHHLWKFPAS